MRQTSKRLDTTSDPIARGKLWLEQSRKGAVERVTQFRCLGVSVSEDLSWSTNITSVIGKAQRRIFYLRKLKSAKIPEQLMVNFYHCAVSGILAYGLLVWFSSRTKAEQQVLQRVYSLLNETHYK